MLRIGAADATGEIPMRHGFHDVFDLFGEPHNPQIAFANYSAPILMNITATTYKTAGVLNPVARRYMLYEAEFGQTSQSPGYATTDVSVEWDLSRGITAAMVGSAVVTNLLDGADGASAALFMNLLTTEPTYTTAGNGL